MVLVAGARVRTGWYAVSGYELDREIERLEKVIEMIEHREDKLIYELRDVTADRDALKLECVGLAARVAELERELDARTKFGGAP